MNRHTAAALAITGLVVGLAAPGDASAHYSGFAVRIGDAYVHYVDSYRCDHGYSRYDRYHHRYHRHGKGHRRLHHRQQHAHDLWHRYNDHRRDRYYDHDHRRFHHGQRHRHRDYHRRARRHH